jgi:uroporphyrinogen III methyltransferase/synthase
MTVRGAAELARAECVVYDRLVSDEVLELMPDGAERIFVGKESGRHPVPQERINEILLEKALEGKRVVRLKGGDPFLFGRGGEELALLRARGVAFEVVPGVTSALAVPAYAGIPVTHRDFCSSVHIITGHAKRDGTLSLNFAALVGLRGTLVFLMGVASMGEILRGLAEAGMAAATPAAVIENGTTALQRKTVGTVGTLSETAAARGVKSPAVLVVGEVCALGEQFDWYGALPLRGMTAIVARPRDRIGTLAGRLAELGARTVAAPCIETEPLRDNAAARDALRGLGGYAWLVLTSPRGAEALGALLEELKLDARALAPVKIGVVGAATEAAVRTLGVRADLVPETYDAGALARELCARVSPGERVLILRAARGTAELTDVLGGAGVAFEDVAVYETRYRSGARAAVAQMLARGEADYVCFTSASTVRGFAESYAEALAGSAFAGPRAVCIGAATERAAREYGFETLRARNAAMEDMVQAILDDWGTK